MYFPAGQTVVQLEDPCIKTLTYFQPQPGVRSRRGRAAARSAGNTRRCTVRVEERTSSAGSTGTGASGRVRSGSAGGTRTGASTRVGPSSVRLARPTVPIRTSPTSRGAGRRALRVLVRSNQMKVTRCTYRHRCIADSARSTGTAAGRVRIGRAHSTARRPRDATIASGARITSVAGGKTTIQVIAFLAATVGRCLLYK